MRIKNLAAGIGAAILFLIVAVVPLRVSAANQIMLQTEISGNSSVTEGHSAAVTLKDGGTVSVSGEGVEGDLLFLVENIDEGDVDYSKIVTAMKGKGSKLRIYNLRFIDSKGQPSQPTGQMAVSISLDGQYTRPCIYYVADDGSTTFISSTVSGDKVSFSTDHNSYYVLAESPFTGGGGSVSTYYTITTSAGAGGYFNNGTAVSVKAGESAKLTITANEGYVVSDVLVDGRSVGAVSSYTFTDVRADHTVSAAFAPIAYTVTVSAKEGGAVSPDGKVSINYDGSRTFAIVPDEGYEIADVLVDGRSVGAVSSYTFSKVRADHTISAAFKKTVTASPELSVLPAKGISGKTYIKLSWPEAEDAVGYEVYYRACGDQGDFKKVKTTTKLTYTHKNLNTRKSYSYYIMSYKKVDGEKVYISKSPQVHAALTGAKRTNVKSIRVVTTGVTLAPKKTYTVKATATLYDKKKKPLEHVAQFRYYTTDKAIAYVDKNGKLTARKAGKCYLYVMANNGVYKRIKVTVKK